MVAFFDKFFAKKDAVDPEKLALQSSISFLNAQSDKKLLAKALEKPLEYTDYLQSLKSQLLFQESDKRNVKSEVAYLKSYLAAFALGLEQAIFFKEQINIEDESVEIPVFILIPLLQNALTWGYNTVEKYPIRIRLKVTSDYLKFEVSNHVNHYIENQEATDLIGNYKARLDLLYPENHSLMINSNTNTFKATLTINFNSLAFR